MSCFPEDNREGDVSVEPSDRCVMDSNHGTRFLNKPEIGSNRYGEDLEGVYWSMNDHRTDLTKFRK